MHASAAPQRAGGFDVGIIGGGAPGITLAAALRRHLRASSVAIIEPSGTHACQPGWTLVGAGIFAMEPSVPLDLRRSAWLLKEKFLPDMHRERRFADAVA